MWCWGEERQEVKVNQERLLEKGLGLIWTWRDTRGWRGQVDECGFLGGRKGDTEERHLTCWGRQEPRLGMGVV